MLLKRIYKNLKPWMRPIDRIFNEYKAYVLTDTHIVPFRKDKLAPTRRIFIDRNSPVLMVAHLDTVMPPRLHGRFKDILYGAGFDDRLGCFLAYNLSQELNCDLLLTDLEESGQTTAQHHTCKDYNWVVEFDRAGNDVVTYDMDNPTFLANLADYWRVGYGSFSDISMLSTKACCMNLGIGYANAHAANSTVDLAMLEKQLDLFRKFYALHSKTKFVREIGLARPYGFYGGHDTWTTGGLYTEDLCDFCELENGEEIYGYYICRNCWNAMVEKATYQLGYGINETITNKEILDERNS